MYSLDRIKPAFLKALGLHTPCYVSLLGDTLLFDEVGADSFAAGATVDRKWKKPTKKIDMWRCPHTVEGFRDVACPNKL